MAQTAAEAEELRTQEERVFEQGRHMRARKAGGGGAFFFLFPPFPAKIIIIESHHFFWGLSGNKTQLFFFQPISKSLKIRCPIAVKVNPGSKQNPWLILIGCPIPFSGDSDHSCTRGGEVLFLQQTPWLILREVANSLWESIDHVKALSNALTLMDSTGLFQVFQQPPWVRGFAFWRLVK